MGNPQPLSAQRSEALIYCAHSHFVLATIFHRAYGTNADRDLGILYTKGPETSVNPQYSRGTIAEVYQNVAADLEEGLPLIGDSIYSRVKYHSNKKTVYAFAARFYPHYTQLDFSNCQRVINYVNIVLGMNASQYLHNWAALGALSPNKNIQPNAYVDANNRANLLVTSAASHWSLVSDPGYANCERYCMNSITASESCKSEGPWGDRSNCHQILLAPSGSIKNRFRRLVIYQRFTLGSSWVGYMLYPVFTTDEVLPCRAEVHILLKRHDEAVADIDVWQKALTKNIQTSPKEIINDSHVQLKYYTSEAPMVKKELYLNFVIEKGMQENLIRCILYARRLLTLEEELRWQDIKHYGIVIYRRYYEGYILVNITDKMDMNDPRRAIQLPASVITVGMQSNPRNDQLT